MKNPLKTTLSMKTPAKQKLHHVLTSDEKISADLEKIKATAALLFITKWINLLLDNFLNYIVNLSKITKNIFSEFGKFGKCII
jgi:hypothetical protein